MGYVKIGKDLLAFFKQRGDDPSDSLRALIDVSATVMVLLDLSDQEIKECANLLLHSVDQIRNVYKSQEAQQ